MPGDGQFRFEWEFLYINQNFWYKLHELGLEIEREEATFGACTFLGKNTWGRFLELPEIGQVGCLRN